jgi:hypothetical protein
MHPTLMITHFIRTTTAIFAIAFSPGIFANIVAFDFDPVPLPVTPNVVITVPYDEEGLRLTMTVGGNPVSGFYMPAATNTYFSGVKAMVPPFYSNGPTVMNLFSPTGRRFTVKSVTLHPQQVISSDVTFTGSYAGNSYQQTHSTGTNLAGITSTFNMNFQRISNLSWSLVPIGGGFVNRHQVSSIVVEFDGVLTTSSALTFTESSGTAAIPIQLAAPRSTDTTLTWQIAAGTATQGTDYTLPGGNSTGSITIPAGQTQALLNVPLTNDTTAESPETFQVIFSAPPVGTGFPGNAATISSTVTIASDDGITDFQGWMTTHSLPANSQPADDANNDGISNIECWLHKLNPAGINPASWIARRGTFTGMASNDPGMVMILPNPLPNDVKVVFSESTNLNGFIPVATRSGFGLGSVWTGPAAGRVIENTTFSSRTVTLRAQIPSGPRPTLFMRLSYELTGSSSAE